MTRRARHLKWTGAIVVTAIALAAAAAEAGSGAATSPASVARGTVASGDDVRERVDAAPRRGGLDRGDAVVAASILAGALLMGFRGYVVVGAAIAVGAAVLRAGARLVTGTSKRRAWADWPSTAEARVAKPKARQPEPRPVRRPEAELH